MSNEEKPPSNVVDLTKIKFGQENEAFNKLFDQVRVEVFDAIQSVIDRHRGEPVFGTPSGVQDMVLDWIISAAMILAHAEGLSREQFIQKVTDDMTTVRDCNPYFKEDETN